MARKNEKNNGNGSRGWPQLIKASNSPLGFYVLALLIVESFLGIVLTFGNIEKEQKSIFIYIGIGLFVFVTIIVTILAWYKPEDLTFDKEAHLANKGIFGSDLHTIKPEKRFTNQMTQE